MANVYLNNPGFDLSAMFFESIDFQDSVWKPKEDLVS
jgi:hypothetical protein